MRATVTGAAGGVGRKVVTALLEAGHEVVATDRVPASLDYHYVERLSYVEADLLDLGSAFAVVHGADAVVHAAAIPWPEVHPPHVVFKNNVISTFNTLEASIASGVPRFVNISSEAVVGLVFAERPWVPDFVPLDESHPVRPQDPYALSKHVGEQLMDAAVRRSGISCVSLRLSWVQRPGDYEEYISPAIADPARMAANVWSYVDLEDVAEACRLAAVCDLAGHEVFYIAAADNAVNQPLEDLVRRYYGNHVSVRATQRPDASGLSSAKAKELLGYTPRRSWRDHLEEDGRPRARARS